MKRWLALTLCLVLLLSATACGGDAEYKRGMRLIAEGKYTEAYTALKTSDDPLAAEELKKFAFVPLTYTRKTPDADLSTVYTYDEAGYPTKVETTRDYTSYMTILTKTYTYVDGVNREFRETEIYGNGSTESILMTYNELGDPLYIAYYSGNTLDMEHRYVYNARGDLLKYTVQGINEHPEYSSCEEYTYDDQGRPLTYVETYEGYLKKSTYVYAEDGSYVRHDKVDDTWRNQVNFDPQGRVVRETQTPVGATAPTRVFEYRYDAAGNTVYEYSKWENSVETTTSEYDAAGNLLYSKTLNQDGRATNIVKQAYNEAGQILTKETTTTGLTWDKTTYTYDEKGRLVNEYISRPNAMVGRDITYTYNENGTLKFLEETGTYGTVRNAYGYDEWGNRIQSLAQRERQETTATATWELHYYPKGVPEDVKEFVKAMDWE